MMDGPKPKGRLSILKKRRSRSLSPQTPTKTERRTLRRISFSGKHAVREFFTGAENKETIWGASYEESTDHHTISHEHLTINSQLLQQTQCKNETVKNEVQMELSMSLSDSINIGNVIEPIKSLKNETIAQNITIETEKIHLKPKKVSVSIFEALRQKRETPNQIRNTSHGDFDLPMEMTQPIRRSVICKSPNKENKNAYLNTNRTIFEDTGMDITQSVARNNDSIHPIPSQNDLLKKNPYLKFLHNDNFWDDTHTENCLAPSKNATQATTMSMDTSDIAIDESTGAVFIDYMESKNEQMMEEEKKLHPIPIEESHHFPAAIDDVDKENIYTDFTRPNEKSTNRKAFASHANPMEISLPKPKYQDLSMDISLEMMDATENITKSAKPFLLRRATSHKPSSMDESVNNINHEPIEVPPKIAKERKNVELNTCYDQISLNRSVEENEVKMLLMKPVSERRATCYKSEPLELSILDDIEVEHNENVFLKIGSQYRGPIATQGHTFDKSLEMQEESYEIKNEQLDSHHQRTNLKTGSRQDRLTIHEHISIDESININEPQFPTTSNSISTRRATSYVTVDLEKSMQNENTAKIVSKPQKLPSNRITCYNNASIDQSVEFLENEMQLENIVEPKLTSSRRATNYIPVDLKDTIIKDESVEIISCVSKIPSESIEILQSPKNFVAPLKSISSRRATTYAHTAIDDTINLQTETDRRLTSYEKENMNCSIAENKTNYPTTSHRSNMISTDSMSIESFDKTKPSTSTNILKPYRSTEIFANDVIGVDSTLNSIKPSESYNQFSFPSSNNSSFASKLKNDTKTLNGTFRDLAFLNNNQIDDEALDLVNSSYNNQMPKLNETSIDSFNLKMPSPMQPINFNDDRLAAEHIAFKKSTKLRRSNAPPVFETQESDKRESIENFIPMLKSRSSILTRRESNTTDPNKSEISFLSKSATSDSKYEIKLDLSGYEKFKGLATPLDVLKNFRTQTEITLQNLKQQLEQQKIKVEDPNSQNVPAPSYRELCLNKLKDDREEIRRKFIADMKDRLAFQAVLPVTPYILTLIINKCKEMNNWHFHDLFFYKGNLNLSNKKLPALQFCFMFQPDQKSIEMQMEENNGILIFTGAKVSINEIWMEKMGAFDRLWINELFLKLPTDVLQLCRKNINLSEFDECAHLIVMDAYRKCNDLRKVILKFLATLENDEKTVYIKHHFTHEWKDIECLIRVKNIEQISRKDVKFYPYYQLQPNIDLLPTGVPFVTALLENIKNYIVLE